MSAKEFYNKKALKYQLQRAIKQDHAYFKDAIIEIMEEYAQQQINLSLGNVVRTIFTEMQKDEKELRDVEFKEGFKEAIRILAIIIKEETKVDVRN